MKHDDLKTGIPTVIESALDDTTAEILLLSELVSALAIVGSDRQFAEVSESNETQH